LSLLQHPAWWCILTHFFASWYRVVIQLRSAQRTRG
jgi:hypothetical protein